MRAPPSISERCRNEGGAGSIRLIHSGCAPVDAFARPAVARRPGWREPPPLGGGVEHGSTREPCICVEG
ncbi:hypothetical protein C7S16_6141 [Burkholderia thailandensis]|uniref:Uncharacterized protein n=1 Tax=Burkholderia thailandensis TaxID=57975 RepID=A0AAW9CTD1_BURTH|nr:hypothetical protein [Burkholderia thailandensis]MDW9251006.1 hypothetical protein [Burkholderia thailandensis]